MKQFWQKLKDKIETVLPMTFGSLILFIVVIYLLYIVGRSVWNNYEADKQISGQEGVLVSLHDDITYLQNQINYYQTYSYKEKEAREKLGYKAPGETAMVLPIDTGEDKAADSGLVDVAIKTPNYRLWWGYFTK